MSLDKSKFTKLTIPSKTVFVRQIILMNEYYENIIKRLNNLYINVLIIILYNNCRMHV